MDYDIIYKLNHLLNITEFFISSKNQIKIITILQDFSRTQKTKIHQNSINLWSIGKILVASILYHYMLHLFVLFSFKNQAKRDCIFKIRPWWMVIPSNRSKIEQTWASHPASSSPCCFCFAESSAKNTYTLLQFPGIIEIRSSCFAK